MPSKNLKRTPVVVEFKPRVRPVSSIIEIRDEYDSNLRMLAHFAQNNPPGESVDGLASLESALLQRQEALILQIAAQRATSVHDIRAKLELWVRETDESLGKDDICAQTSLVLSVLQDLQNLRD